MPPFQAPLNNINWLSREIERQIREVLATALLSDDNNERLKNVIRHCVDLKQEVTNHEQINN